MIAEEGFDDMRLVGLVAPLHHRRERARGECRAFFHMQRREGQRRRSFELAGHEKAAGRQGGQRISLRSRRSQIGREQIREALGLRLAFGRIGGDSQRRAAPVGRERRARSCGAGFQRLARPLRVALGQKRQVEEPFAGIVDNVDGEFGRALPQALAPLELEREPQFGDAARRFRPVAFVPGQGGQMILVGEARHVVVGLWLQFRAHQPTFGMNAKDRQHALAIHGGRRCAQQILHQGGDEDSLARA